MASYEQDPTDPTGIKDLTPRGNSEVTRARVRKAHAALNLRLAGWTWAHIAEVEGFPSGRAAQMACERAMEEELLTEESQKHLRKMVHMRYEQLLRATYPMAIDPENPNLFAAQKAVRETLADMRRLMGLDAPQQYVVSSPTSADLEKWVATVLQREAPALQEADIFAGDTIPGETVPSGT